MSEQSPPLHFEQVGEDDAPRVAYLLHGILGSGRNLRSIGRMLSQRYPDWRVVLPDLRNHGQSPLLVGPHTVAAAAKDLDRLGDLTGRPEIVIGHSFGGKVALAYGQAHGGDGLLRQLAVLDARPDADHASAEVRRVIEAVFASPLGHRGQGSDAQALSREEIRAHLTQEGLSAPLVAWLLTSTARTDRGWIWTYNLDGIRSMLQDYRGLDLLPFVSSLPPSLSALFVMAGRTDRWDRTIVQRLERAPRVQAVRLDAGHWVHTEDPQGVLAALGPLFEG